MGIWRPSSLAGIGLALHPRRCVVLLWALVGPEILLFPENEIDHHGQGPSEIGEERGILTYK
ncbi:MAG: hypothetical protein KAS81_05055, partial [Anaerolineales bacterium]|nr:hypothetical protein [Anaerolineales bacterium]